MNISYNEFHKADPHRKMESLRQHKRKDLGQDVALWWLPQKDEPNEQDERKLLIRLFSSLPSSEKFRIRANIMALFPEIFSSSGRKFSRIPTWLASRYGIVSPNIRDHFTAGGKKNIVFDGNSYLLPAILGRLDKSFDLAHKFIVSADQYEIDKYWDNLNLTYPWQENEIILAWIEVVSENSKNLKGMPNNFPVKDWLLRHML